MRRSNMMSSGRGAILALSFLLSAAGDGEGQELIGEIGNEGTELFNVVGVAAGVNGAVLVGEARPPRLSLVRDGQLVTVATEGPGPRELRYPWWTGDCGGAVGVFDVARAEMVLFSWSGVWLESRPLPASVVGFHPVLRCTSHGRDLLLWMDRFVAPPGPGGWAYPAGYLVSVREGRTDTLFVMDSVAAIYQGLYADVVVPAPLSGRRAEVTIGRDRIFLGSMVADEILVLDNAGRLLRTLTLRPKRRRVSAGQWEQAIEEEARRVPDLTIRERVRRVLETEIERPRTMPQFDRVRADNLDRLWIRSTERFGEPEATWYIFSETGEHVGHATLPRALDPIQITRTQLLGVYRDELDVEHIRVYRLRPDAAER